jgi:hypothetical protein
MYSARNKHDAYTILVMASLFFHFRERYDVTERQYGGDWGVSEQIPLANTHTWHTQTQTHTHARTPHTHTVCVCVYFGVYVCVYVCVCVCHSKCIFCL